MNKSALMAILAVPVVVILIMIVLASKKPDRPKGTQTQTDEQRSTQTNSQEVQKAPEMQIDKTKKYLAVVTTSEGVMKISLNTDKTPITSNNFISLSKKGFYNNTIFHRVINGFMIQGGDPTGTGTGGPGYQFNDEPFEGEYTAGTIAMANAGPNTNGSQFFIMHKDYALPKNYVIFGKVVEGMDVVDKIATVEVIPSEMGEKSKPMVQITIKNVEIVEQ